MQTSDSWHKFDLRRYQVAWIVLLSLWAGPLCAQNYNTDNLVDYDYEWIHYGFHMGIHSSKYRIKYDDLYTSPALDSLHSVAPLNTGGWRVGFVVNMRVLPSYLDFRLLPTVGFYENQLIYRFTDGNIEIETKDATTVELPMLLKYKSARRGNVAMYAVGGMNVALEVAGRGDNFNVSSNLKLKNFNYSIDTGFGFDMYFPLFKFSPEIRYTWGLRNMLPSQDGPFSEPFKSLTYENFAFYITFEGGPSYLKYLRQKKRQQQKKKRLQQEE